MGNRILCYGDSNTYGYDPRSYLGGRYPGSVRWTALLRSQGYEVFNAGQNGRSIPQSDWEIELLVQMLHRHEPDVTTIMLGTNDLLKTPGISASDCTDRMEQFLSALFERDESCRFLLVAPPPMTLGAWVDDLKIVELSQQLGVHYQTAAQKLGIAFANAGSWNVELTYDGVHFSEHGHWNFFSGMCKQLLELEGSAL